MIDLDRYPYIGYDTETTGLQYPVDQVFGVSLALPDGQAFYWDIREEPHIADWLDRALAGYQGRIICHGASFDYRMSHATGIHLNIDALDCTIIRACCIDEHLHEYGLDALCGMYLDEYKVNSIYQDLANLFGGKASRNVQMKNLHRAPAHVVRGYAVKDAQLVLALWEWQQQEIRNQSVACVPDLDRVMDFERSMLPRFIRMEMNGIRVDVEAAKMAQMALDKQCKAYEAELTALVGKPINVNSGPQIRALLDPYFEEGEWLVSGIPVGTTKNGGPSLDAMSMRAVADAGNPAAGLILDIRSLIKTRDTFLGGHVIGHNVNGRVYPTINQSKGENGGTGTGRLSYQDPALQQIPSRNKAMAAVVKDVFLPDIGHEWLDVDESSFEVRIFAHLVANFDPRVAKMYRANPRLDFHQWVADLTHLRRNATYNGEPNAKQLNLSMIFNQGPGATAMKMGMPWEWDSFEAEDGKVVRYRRAGPEARAVIDKYHDALPGVKLLQNKCTEAAKAREFIYTFKGRRIRFPKGYKAYKASGLLIQATAAEYNKENIRIIDDYFGVHNGRLLLNTHDSYSMSIPKGSFHDLWPGLRDRLDSPDRANVPLVMEVSGVGESWWDALIDTAGVTA